VRWSLRGRLLLNVVRARPRHEPSLATKAPTGHRAISGTARFPLPLPPLEGRRRAPATAENRAAPRRPEGVAQERLLPSPHPTLLERGPRESVTLSASLRARHEGRPRGATRRAGARGAEPGSLQEKLTLRSTGSRTRPCAGPWKSSVASATGSTGRTRWRRPRCGSSAASNAARRCSRSSLDRPSETLPAGSRRPSLSRLARKKLSGRPGWAGAQAVIRKASLRRCLCFTQAPFRAPGL
jgi:hypothetical protein